MDGENGEGSVEVEEGSVEVEERTKGRDLSLDDGSSLTSNNKRELVITVDDAIEKIGFGPFQVLITVFCGLLWVAEAMELMLLSILSPIVKCQWSLTEVEEALITSIVFFGVFLGGVFWGVVYDAIGRKRGLLIVDIFILVFGILSALKISSDDGRLPGYPWLLICRFGVGFFSAGTSQVITYYAEFLPRKGRGVCIIFIAMWWSIGTMFGALLAIGVLGLGGLSWHWYLGLAATPLGLVLFLFPLVPESARFYLVKGKFDKAQKVIERIAKMNFKKVPSGRLVSQEEKDKKLVVDDVVVYRRGVVSISGDYSDVSPGDGADVITNDYTNEVEVQHQEDLQLQEDEVDGNSDAAQLLIPEGSPNHEVEVQHQQDLQLQEDEVDSNSEAAQLLIPEGSPNDEDVSNSMLAKLINLRQQIYVLFVDGMWKTTVILLFLWFGASWLYYGVVLLTTTLLRFDPHCASIDNASRWSNMSGSSCEDLQLDTADYLKILWSAGAEIPGLVLTLVIIEIIGRKKTIAIEFLATTVGFLLLFICTSDVLLTVFLFIIRAFTTGLFQGLYVYTPEVYPTKSRALGLGFCNSAARVGGILTPVMAQVLFTANDYATISIYAGSCVVFGVLTMLLPIETKGRALRDTR